MLHSVEPYDPLSDTRPVQQQIAIYFCCEDIRIQCAATLQQTNPPKDNCSGLLIIMPVAGIRVLGFRPIPQTRYKRAVYINLKLGPPGSSMGL